MTCTPTVQAVKPVRSTLDDTAAYISNLLADAEALNDEIDHFKQVAQQAQQREVEAVKRIEQLEQQISRNEIYADELRQILKRSQERETEAVNRCESIERDVSALAGVIYRLERNKP